MDLLYRVKTLWAALRGNHYTWPAIDITLPGNRHFHLIGSIHMGSLSRKPDVSTSNRWFAVSAMWSITSTAKTKRLNSRVMPA